MKKAVEQYVCPECGLKFWVDAENDLNFVPKCPRCKQEIILSNEVHMIENNTELLQCYWATFYNIKLFGEYTCPKCKRGDLVIRQGNRGKFWGCTNYPDCKFTQKIDPKKARRRALHILNDLMKKSEQGKLNKEKPCVPIPF